MKVRELIKILSNFDQDQDVAIEDSSSEQELKIVGSIDYETQAGVCILAEAKQLTAPK